MSQNKKNSRVSMALFTGLFLTLGGLSLFNKGTGVKGLPDANSINSTEYSSISSKKADRKTELGKIVYSKQKKEITDPQISKMWGLKSMQAIKAWNKLKIKGDKKIIVAIIDTGIDTKHPDLKQNLWVNKKEIPGNGIDDDKNGFIDDVHGANLITKNGNIKDNHGHGSHIAGIIGATHGNGIGISGVAPNVSMMILKYYDPKAPGINNLINTVEAIKYATKHGAHIINYSGGGLEPSSAEKRAITQARKKGILFVAAAGNERSNSDIHGYYPADYKMDNIISVTAINKQQYVLPSSNYGVSSVDIAAPGNDIRSTLPGGGYGPMTGTSQATAFVTGVAALIMSRYPDFNPQKIITHLSHTGDFDQKLTGKTKYKKKLNTYRALTILDKGVSATGIIAENVNNMAEDRFTINTRQLSSRNINQSLLQTSKQIDSLTGFAQRMNEELSKQKTTAESK